MFTISTLCALAHAALPAEPRVEVLRLAEGVYAAVRREPLSLAGNGNSLIVVGDRDVLVVDAQFTREAAAINGRAQ